ncbi:MAG: YajG family lipoprotein [Bacteroidota bacterium]
MKKYVSHFFLIVLILLMPGHSFPKTTSNQRFNFESNKKIEIGDIIMPYYEEYDIDVKNIFRTELESSLSEKGLLCIAKQKNDCNILNIKVNDYEMGSTFKRWLLPGFGATILEVKCELKNSKGELIAIFEHSRSITSGGLLTIEGSTTVIKKVSKDITEYLEKGMTGKVGDFWIHDPLFKKKKVKKKSSFIVNLDPWPENENEIPKAKIVKSVNLIDFTDSRLEKERIGKRTAAFNQSMGYVFFNRDVIGYFDEAFRNEMLATGNRISDNDYEITINGELIKFWVRTETTLTHWDVIAEIELVLIVENNSKDKLFKKKYISQGSSRTYIWPSKKIVSQVIEESFRKLMYDIRKDNILID